MPVLDKLQTLAQLTLPARPAASPAPAASPDPRPADSGLSVEQLLQELQRQQRVS
jgi:hypothetical protein